MRCDIGVHGHSGSGLADRGGQGQAVTVAHAEARGHGGMQVRPRLRSGGLQRGDAPGLGAGLIVLEEPSRGEHQFDIRPSGVGGTGGSAIEPRSCAGPSSARRAAVRGLTAFIWASPSAWPNLSRNMRGVPSRGGGGDRPLPSAGLRGPFEPVQSGVAQCRVVGLASRRGAGEFLEDLRGVRRERARSVETAGEPAMIHSSSRACPGGSWIFRRRSTRPSRLVIVPPPRPIAGRGGSGRHAGRSRT